MSAVLAMTCYATRCYEPIPGLGDAVIGVMLITFVICAIVVGIIWMARK